MSCTVFTRSGKISRWNPANWLHEGYHFTLWCEYPDQLHPCCEIGSGGPGEWLITEPENMLVQIAPYAAMLAKLLVAATTSAFPGAQLLAPQPRLILDRPFC